MAVTVLQTTLLYVVLPLALFLFISLLAAGKGLARRPRYRVGQPWS